MHAEGAPKDRARTLFEQGKVAFGEARYEEAERLFQQAFDLDPTPALLLNIAQSQRLGGDCHAALQSYRRYLATNDTAERRRVAEIHSQRLTKTCPDPVPTAATPVAQPDVKTGPAINGTPVGAEPPQPPFPWRTVAWVSAATAITLGGTAFGIYDFNQGQRGQWRAEDMRLADPTILPEESQPARETNNELARSIDRVDDVWKWLAVGSAVAGVVSAVSFYKGYAAPTVAPQGDRLTLRWTF